MTIIEQIKAEIERLKEENNNIRCDSNKAYCQGYDDAFVDLLPFLDTLESEKPMNQEELEKEISLWISENENIHHNDRLMVGLLKDVSNHFYDLGCTRTAERYDEIEYNRQRAEESVPNDLEEAAEEYEKRVIEETKCHHNALTYAEGYEDALLLIPGAFIDGAKWQKLKDEERK